MTNIERLEQCLGETVMYFTDSVDLRIRQGDKEALQKVAMLREAHIIAAKMMLKGK